MYETYIASDLTCRALAHEIFMNSGLEIPSFLVKQQIGVFPNAYILFAKEFCIVIYIFFT